MKQILCSFCHKKFHRKGISTHKRHCKSRWTDQTVQTTENLNRISDMKHEYDRGRNEALMESKAKLNSVALELAKSVAQINDAFAHALDYLRSFR